MPMKLDETSFTFDVPIPDDIKPGLKKEFLQKVGQYLVDSMLDKIADGISPVAGVGKFQKLTKHYADEEKGGERTANMDEHGDMLSALTYKIIGNKIKVGIFDDKQAIKSYAHNTGFKGHPTLEGKAPKRQFIPNEKEGEKLKSDILAGIGDITDEYIS
jgi:hypothetical protein